MALAEKFCRGVVVCSVKPHVGSLSPTGSLVTVSDAKVSAIKVSQDGKNTVVRVYNPTEKTVNAKIGLLRRPETAWLTDSLERDISELQIVGNGAELRLSPFQTATVKFAKQ